MAPIRLEIRLNNSRGLFKGLLAVGRYGPGATVNVDFAIATQVLNGISEN